MTDKELMQQALDALEIACDRHGTVGGAQTDWGKWDAAAHALRARLAQPEQEPVAWMSQGGDVSRSRKHFKEMGFTNLIPLYTAPPQREWQGLTDEEVLSVMESAKDFQGRIAMTWVNHENQTYVTDVGNRIARAIEQTLREKNT